MTRLGMTARDRRGVASLEHAVLAAAVITAMLAALGSIQARTSESFARIEAATAATGATVRWSPF
jgi:Flp pilus assembly pilin Flp